MHPEPEKRKRAVLGLRAQLDQCHGNICLQIRPAAGIIKQYARALPARESAAVLRAWDGPGRAAPGKEKAWLAQVTVNHCRNLLTAAAVAVILTIGALAASGILSRTTYLTGGQMTVRDGNDLIHDVLVGGTPDNYSYFEFLYHQDGSLDSVLGTYPDGYDGYHEPAWLIAYRQAQRFPEVNEVSEIVQPADKTS